MPLTPQNQIGPQIIHTARGGFQVPTNLFEPSSHICEKASPVSNASIFYTNCSRGGTMLGAKRNSIWLMDSKNPITWPLWDALKTAQAVLDQIGPIEGSIALASYAHHVVSNWAIDPDFVVFGAIASSTNFLSRDQRSLCNPNCSRLECESDCI
jgi:hypothetical protein